MNEPNVITYEMADKALKMAIEAKGPDYVYPRGQVEACVYYENAQPSCLVGYVLSTLGYEPFEEGSEENKYSVNELFKRGLIAVDDYDEEANWSPTLFLLGQVQNYQDTGTCWGQAVAAAKQPLAPA